MLRQTNEVELQQHTQDVRFLQLQQAKKSTSSLLRTRSVTLERYKYYLWLLGATIDGDSVPDTFAVPDDVELTEESWDDAYGALVESFDRTIALTQYPALQLDQGSAPSNQSGATGSGQLYLNKNEGVELNRLLPSARDLRYGASVINIMASVLTFIPEIGVDLAFWGLGADSKVFGGSKLSDAIKVQAEGMQMLAALAQDDAGMASRTASYQRRADEWIHQANLAARELMQIGRQLLGSIIAQQVARHEYDLVKKQIEQSAAVQDYLQQKFTSEQLYLWMQGELSSLYYQYYRMAVDAGRKAEQTVKQELMRPEVDATTFVQFNYWDAGHQGLHSGEALYFDLKRLEASYIDNNRHELERTVTVSLRQLNPMALITLRTTGACTFTIPEWFFDRECPGQYMRRIKLVSLSIPAVVGPFTNVACTVTQQSSSVRVSALPSKSGGYAREGSDDDRFIDYFGSNDVIVTSSGNRDSGMFDASIQNTRLREEIHFPFEYTGAADSLWKLQLPADFPSFDFRTITDIATHLSFTARRADDQMATLCVANLKKQFKSAGSANLSSPSNLSVLFMLRNDFPGEWAAFTTNAAATPDFKFTLRMEHFPYFVQSAIRQGMKLVIGPVLLYGDDLKPASPQPDMTQLQVSLNKVQSEGSISVSLPSDASALKKDASQVHMFIGYSLTN